MNNTLVSVIVPLFNYEKYISDCIRSVINQDYENFELIIVDDCSDDNSYKMACSFECKKIKVLKLEKNSGYSKAKNEGIILSKGDLITCLDADDMFTKNSISSRVNAIKDQKIDFVHADALSIKGDVSLEDCYEGKLRKMRETPKIHAQTVMVLREVYIKYGLYDERLRSRADKEMWIRLFGDGCKGKHLVKKGYIKIDVAYYRKHGNSMMSQRSRSKKLQENLTKKLKEYIKMRVDDGITKKNTRFLEK